MLWRERGEQASGGLCHTAEDLSHVHNVRPSARVHVSDVLRAADLHPQRLSISTEIEEDTIAVVPGSRAGQALQICQGHSMKWSSYGVFCHGQSPAK